MAAKKKRVQKKPGSRFAKGMQEGRFAEEAQRKVTKADKQPEKQYVAIPKQPYHNLQFNGTPTHPQLRDHYFPKNVQLEYLRLHTSSGKSYFTMLMVAVGLQGVNRRRIELEQEVADRVLNYNELVLRMNTQLGKTIDQLVLPYTRPRTHLDEYNDIDALVKFFTKHWEISRDGKPVPEQELRKQVEKAYSAGRTVAEQSFAAEYKGPGYGEEFAKQAKKLLRDAHKEAKAGRLK